MKMLQMMTLGCVAAVCLALGNPTSAMGQTAHARLEGFQEVPAVSTSGEGTFRVKISKSGSIEYELEYSGIEGNIAQAHIHFAQTGVNGSIVVFLCTNLGNGPAGTQLCPPSPGGVTGTITATDVLDSGTGIEAGEFDALVEALREGVAYVNVHSDLFPGGEIRGQID